MTQGVIRKLLTAKSPGEFRAVAIDESGQAACVFSQRWSGHGERARHGTVHEARLRTFADELRGAFCQLASGEEVFLRLTTRDGLTEGAAIRVQVQSEKRAEKLARVRPTEAPIQAYDAYEAWRADLNTEAELAVVEDCETVTAIFEDALAPSVTLAKGGTLHIARTRALTAVDVDTAGRRDKGSAGARALAINRAAITELARQVALRGLGGTIVLDCLSPINADAATQLQQAGKAAFRNFKAQPVRVLKPSPLGLLELSVPWRVQPLADVQSERPHETTLLDLLREGQREAERDRHKFFHLALCANVWRAYETRKRETDHALQEMFSGRVTIVQSQSDINEVRRL